MISSNFSWVQTHKELAQYLADMEGRQKELIELLRECGVTAGLVDEDPKGNRFKLEEIDPFSFFCFIYKYGRDKRLQILQSIAGKLDLHFPEDELGIPSAQAQKVMMYPFRYKRENDEIKKLWDFFYSVLEDSVSNENFMDVLEINGVGKVKITETLFYVDPENYFPINGPTKPYLKKVLGIDPNYSSWQEYLEILDKVKENTDKPFYETSHEAWLWLEEQKKQDKKYAAFQELVDRYKRYLKEEGIGKERYKWEAIHHFQQAFDLEAEDFTESFKTAISKAVNLVYQYSIGYIRKAVDYFSEEVREMFTHLYDESVPLQDRCQAFVKASEKLLPRVIEKHGKELNHFQDERAISYYLTMRYPERYPLYKNETYQYLISLLDGQQAKPAGEKFFHYLELAEDLVPVIESDDDVIDMVEEQLTEDCYRGEQQWLVFQDVLWINMRNIDDIGDAKWNELKEVVSKIDDEQAVRKFFATVQEVLNEFDLSPDDEVTYASSIDKNLQFTIGSRYVTNLKWKKGKSIQGFYVDNEYLDELKAKLLNLKVSDKSLPPEEGEMTWVYIESEDVQIEDFLAGIKALARKGVEGQEKSQFRSIYPDKHNPWIAKVALDDSLLEKLLRGEKMADQKETVELNYPLNTIFYGPPGTGKTYNTIHRAAEIVEGRLINDYDEAKAIFNSSLGDTIEFITFHQNYSYEDFIQGLRPNLDGGDQLSFKKSTGVFKRLADEALKNYNESRKSQEELNKKKAFEAALETLKEQILESEDQIKINETAYFIGVEDDAFRYTGDNWTLGGKGFNGFRMKYSDLLHFFESNIQERKDIKELNNVSGLAKQHASYFFKTFEIVKDLMPDLNSISGSVSRKNYVLIIDEINRANISRVFGELITLIEPDKRYGREHHIPAKLPSDESFSVPENLYIIGTMNTADKSIALLDIALRRRFEFEAMYPLYHIKNGPMIFDTDVLEKINEKIVKLKGHDFQIGHSYFMNNSISLKDRMNRTVIPLLLEYFMNDEKEVRGILEHSGLEVEEKSWPLRITGKK